MTKIIKVTDDDVLIANDNKTVTKVPRVSFDFEPTMHQKVEIYQLDGEYIVTKAEEPPVLDPTPVPEKTSVDNIKDKLNINIVNENKTQNYNRNDSSTDNQSPEKTGGVTKWLFVLVCIFFGGFGGNYFMLGKPFIGILCILFSWTYIPSIISLVHFFTALFKTPDAAGKIYFS